ncbi:ATP-grasp domain-containing protein [Rosistilla oblonga]|uniref:ATP-grasp domain-containing protein n=1 Tax=Rosistilla oblonga TaxID=2527990 RepID=UPI003A96C19C
MPRCAFLTIANQDGWLIDDYLVHEPLRQQGWDIGDLAWDGDVDWDAFDVVVIRSTWDYQYALDRFLAVLKQIDESKATLCNSLATVRWNADKCYLFDLQRRGIEAVPTQHVMSPTPDDIQNALVRFDASQIVVKPTVGAGSVDTFRITPATPLEDLASHCETLAGRSCFIQPFMDGITAEGEFSLIYIDGQLSHTILKTVRDGDFRVQSQHGGGVTFIPEPEAALVAAADRVIAALDEVPLYARVDLVRTQQESFALMELELIEPRLYFEFAEHSPQLFANAIARRSTQNSSGC